MMMHYSRHTVALSSFLPLLFGLFLSVSIAFNSQANDAKTAYLRGDLTTAFNLWQAEANSGDAEAQFNIAFMYENGEGTGVDLIKAVKWYELAARQNYPAASAMAEKTKLKIKELKAENLRAWLPKAEAGKTRAQHAVAEILAAGEYTAKDNIEAMKWLILALEAAPDGTARNRMMRFRDTLNTVMSASDVEASRLRVKDWKKLRPEIYETQNN